MSDAPSRSWPYWTTPSRVDVDGTAVAYRRAGEGRPILFLHGIQLTRAWLPFHAALAAGADVVAPEQPGFGDTPRPDTLRSFDDLVLHTDAVLRSLGLDADGGADLVGQGHGAWLAARLAVTYPERFHSLTLITPFGLRLEDVDSVDIFRLTEDEEQAALLNTRAEEFASIFEREPEPEATLVRFEERTALTYAAWNPRYDWRLDEWLRRVQIPTLVVGADDDRYGANGQADRYAELIAGARLERVTGTADAPSSHLIHIEAPEAVAGLVLDHVGRS